MSKTKKILRTSKGLQDELFNQIDQLNSGETTPQAARTVASLASGIIQSARLEMDYSRFINNKPPKQKEGAKELAFGNG